MPITGYTFNPIENELDLITTGLLQSEIIPDFAISGFNVTNGTIFEVGGSTTPQFSWGTNANATSGNINSQSLTGLPASSGTLTFASSISTTTNFTLTVSDGVNTRTSTRTVSFVNAFRDGVDTPGASDSDIQAMTKRIVSKGNYTRSFTTSSQVQYYAYPASYGTLVSIRDVNNFETISDWLFRTGTIDGVTYNIYEFKNLNTVVNYNYTFTF